MTIHPTTVRAQRLRRRGDHRRRVFAVRLLVRPAVYLALFWIVWSCAGSDSNVPLDPAKLANQIPRLEERARRRPNDPVSLCDLGVTLYHLGNPERAMPLLRQTILYDPTRLPAALVVAREHWKERRLEQAEQLLDVQRPVTELEKSLVRSFRWQISDARARKQALVVARRRKSGTMDQAFTLVVFDLDPGQASKEMQALALATTEAFREELQEQLGDRMKFDIWARHVRQSLERLDAGEAGRTQIEPLASIATVRGVQQRLTLLLSRHEGRYYEGTTDGVLGPETSDAIKHFQRDHAMPVDGIVGPTTRAVLEEIVNRQFVQAPPAARSRVASEAARLAGVRYALDGRFWKDTEGRVQVRLDWIDALDDAVIQTWVHDLPASEIGRLAPDLAGQVLRHPLFGIERGESTQASPPASTAPDSLISFGFGEGIRQERLGRWEDASDQYARVLQRRPDFVAAARASRRLAMHGSDWDKFLELSVRDALDR